MTLCPPGFRERCNRRVSQSVLIPQCFFDAWLLEALHGQKAVGGDA
jgi:hypothetical protein